MRSTYFAYAKEIRTKERKNINKKEYRCSINEKFIIKKGSRMLMVQDVDATHTTRNEDKAIPIALNDVRP